MSLVFASCFLLCAFGSGLLYGITTWDELTTYVPHHGSQSSKKGISLQARDSEGMNLKHSFSTSLSLSLSLFDELSPSSR